MPLRMEAAPTQEQAEYGKPCVSGIIGRISAQFRGITSVASMMGEYVPVAAPVWYHVIGTCSGPYPC